MAPQRDTLLLVSLADAIITVAVHVVAGVAVMQVDVGGAVRAGTGAELREITRVAGFTARCACWLQLRANVDSSEQASLSKTTTVKPRQIRGELKIALEKYLANLVKGVLRIQLKESWLACQCTSYLTVLAALSVCTNSIPLQGAGSSIAAGIHTFLQMEKKGKRSQAEKANISEAEQK